jgi:hypothetical protein
MSEQIDANQTTPESTAQHANGHEAPPRKRVRGRSAEAPIHARHHDRAEGLAHPSNQLVAQLNASWRVVDDPLQWKLQRKKGNTRKKNSGWPDRSFCRTRDGLLRCVRECCGEVEPAALAKLSALPQYHPDEDVSLRGIGHAATSAAARRWEAACHGSLAPNLVIPSQTP